MPGGPTGIRNEEGGGGGGGERSACVDLLAGKGQLRGLPDE